MIYNINHFTSAVPPTFTKKEGKISAKSASFQENMQNTLAARDRLDAHQVAGKLSAEELSQLSKKYPSGHMTQDEYDAFLDELEEKGVLSKDDKMLVKNPGMRFGDVLMPGSIAPGDAYVEANPLTPPKSLFEYDGDATVYVKALLAYELELAERVSPCKEDRQRIAALRKVADILEGMRM